MKRQPRRSSGFEVQCSANEQIIRRRCRRGRAVLLTEVVQRIAVQTSDVTLEPGIRIIGNPPVLRLPAVTHQLEGLEGRNGFGKIRLGVQPKYHRAKSRVHRTERRRAATYRAL